MVKTKGGEVMLKRVYLEITNVCNLSCSFCPGTKRQRRFLSPEEFRHLAQQLVGHTRYLYLHVMGEPLLHPQLPQLLSIAADLGFRVCLTTNGTLLEKALPTLLEAQNLHKLSVSLHSFEGNDGGDPRTYVTQAARCCHALSQQGVICALRLWNEGGQNEKNEEILQILSAEWGIPVQELPLDGRNNRKISQNLYLESAEKFDWPDLSAPEGGVEFCLGLRQQAAVLCDGTVVPCCLDGEGQIPLGNLFTQSMDEILASPRAKAIVEGFSRRQPTEDLCRRCGYARRFSKG